MFLRLVTGLPGSGKSLSVVEWLRKFQQEKNKGKDKDAWRPVYAVGINGLDESLAEVMDADKLPEWTSLPTGSIVVVDECQKYMPMRRSGERPQWIQDLSEHRHMGIDFILISQHPSLIDSYVRKLVDQHWHVIRKYGTQIYSVYQWSICQADPNSKTAKKTVDRKLTSKYSTKAMQLYKSAEIHTVKRRLPRWLFIIVGGLIAAPLLGYMGVKYLSSETLGLQGDQAVKKPATAGNQFLGGSNSGQSRTLSKAQWLRERIPRVVSQPWSAPVYDGLARTTVPDLRCISIVKHNGSVSCHCYSEQGTPVVGIEFGVCKSYALHGVYNPHRPQYGQGGFGRDGGGSDRGRSLSGLPAKYEPPDRTDSGADHSSASRHIDWSAGVGSQVYLPPGAP